jgi:hypothetical protein
MDMAGEETQHRSRYRVMRKNGYTREGRIGQLNGAPRIPMLRMSSSNIAAAGYDHGLKILRVRFVRGAAYDYLDVPAAVFKDLLKAPSKGRFLNSQVKPYYAYRHLPKRSRK